MYWLRVVLMGVFFLITSFMVGKYFEGDQKVKENIFKGIATVLLSLEIGRLLWLAYNGTLTVHHWPLHLCSWTIFLIVFQGYGKTKLAKPFVLLGGGVGAIFGLLIPDNPLSPLALINIQSVISHGLILVVYYIWIKEMDVLTKRDLLNTKGILTLGLVIAFGANIVLGTNFFFIAHPDFTPWIPEGFYRILMPLIYFLLSDALFFIMNKWNKKVELPQTIIQKR